MPVLQGALLCDHAADYGGKVSILGGFVSVLVVPVLPRPAPIFFAGRIAFSDTEAQETHVIWLRAFGPTGQQLAEIRGEFHPQPQPQQNPVPELMGGANLVLQFPFPVLEHGVHRIELSVDDDVPMVSLPLVVVDRPPGQ